MKNSPSLNLQQTVPLTWAHSSDLHASQARALEHYCRSLGIGSTFTSVGSSLVEQGGRNDAQSYRCIQTLLGGWF